MKTFTIVALVQARPFWSLTIAGLNSSTSPTMTDARTGSFLKRGVPIFLFLNLKNHPAHTTRHSPYRKYGDGEVYPRSKLLRRRERLGYALAQYLERPSSFGVLVQCLPIPQPILLLLLLPRLEETQKKHKSHIARQIPGAPHQMQFENPW